MAFTSGRKCLGGKIPYSIGMKDDSPFVFPGLWEGWKDPATDEWLRTCAIITGDPNDLLARIHTRRPVILPEEHHDHSHSPAPFAGRYPFWIASFSVMNSPCFVAP